MEDKRIISAALTGNWGDKSTNPAIPMTPEEMAEDAYQCWKAGAAVVHLHMRDEEGRPTMRTDLFEKTIKLIRERCDVIINITSSGGHSLDGMAADETRMLPFRTLKPEMGSYDCGTLNWLHKTVLKTIRSSSRIWESCIRKPARNRKSKFSTWECWTMPNIT